jgi:hypothetical protein
MTDAPKTIFVFGSNTAGIHGAGAAAHARKRLGAQWGVGEGPTGHTYALPTKGHTSANRIGATLSMDKIQKHVNTFIEYAAMNPDRNFQVTCVGCGLAGLKHEQIAPMFKKAPDNCFFDTLWKPWLPEKKFWGTF